jgi:hypothetical protein
VCCCRLSPVLLHPSGQPVKGCCTSEGMLHRQGLLPCSTAADHAVYAAQSRQRLCKESTSCSQPWGAHEGAAHPKLPTMHTALLVVSCWVMHLTWTTEKNRYTPSPRECYRLGKSTGLATLPRASHLAVWSSTDAVLLLDRLWLTAVHHRAAGQPAGNPGPLARALHAPLDSNRFPTPVQTQIL